VHRSRAGDERNERSLSRWNDNLRQQWEIEHLNPGPPHLDPGSAQISASGPRSA
jgi:hypothetical protein